MSTWRKSLKWTSRTASCRPNNYNKLLEQLQNSNDKYSKIEKKVGALQKVVDDLETIVDDLAHRRNCVEISGINPAADQSCEALVWSLGQEIGLVIEEYDISTAHPLPTYNESKDNKIIVKFTRRALEMLFMRTESLKSGFPWKQQRKQGIYFGIAVPLPKEAQWHVINSLHLNSDKSTTP